MEKFEELIPEKDEVQINVGRRCWFTFLITFFFYTAIFVFPSFVPDVPGAPGGLWFANHLGIGTLVSVIAVWLVYRRSRPTQPLPSDLSDQPETEGTTVCQIPEQREAPSELSQDVGQQLLRRAV